MKTYRVAPSVRWSVGRTTLTINDGRGCVRTVGYPESAIWDLMSRYRYDDVVKITGHIASLAPADAAHVVRSALECWSNAGLIEEV